MLWISPSANPSCSLSVCNNLIHTSIQVPQGTAEAAAAERQHMPAWKPTTWYAVQCYLALLHLSLLHPSLDVKRYLRYRPQASSTRSCRSVCFRAIPGHCDVLLNNPECTPFHCFVILFQRIASYVAAWPAGRTCSSLLASLCERHWSGSGWIMILRLSGRVQHLWWTR